MTSNRRERPETLPLRREFQPSGVYLDSATYGLPPKVGLEALAAATAAWARGRYAPVSCDQAVGRARATFARLHGLRAEDVAIGHQVSPMVGLIAASMRPRARVLAVEGDFTSLLFPLLAPRRHPGVRLAAARRRTVLGRRLGWVQMAVPPARYRVHDDRARTA
jgi:hypothetical protein